MEYTIKANRRNAQKHAKRAGQSVARGGAKRNHLLLQIAARRAEEAETFLRGGK